MNKKVRCAWPSDDPLMIKYHDTEWGTPLYNDRKLFEFLVLDTFQAGLSWSIILKKRENFRKAFDRFNPEKIAKYTQRNVTKLLSNEGIVRNRLKINATITNAQQFLKIKKEFKGFHKYIWQFTGHKTIQHKFKTLKQLPTTTRESDAMSKDLKLRGFKFVGSTTCYAFMQAAGMVNDHTVDCFRYETVNGKQ